MVGIKFVSDHFAFNVHLRRGRRYVGLFYYNSNTLSDNRLDEEIMLYPQ